MGSTAALTITCKIYTGSTRASTSHMASLQRWFSQTGSNGFASQLRAEAASSEKVTLPQMVATSPSLDVVKSAAVDPYSTSCATYRSGSQIKAAATCTSGNTASCATLSYVSGGSTVKTSGCDSTSLCTTVAIRNNRCKKYKASGVEYTLYCSATTPSGGFIPSGTTCTVASAGTTKPSVIFMVVAALF